MPNGGPTGPGARRSSVLGPGCCKPLRAAAVAA